METTFYIAFTLKTSKGLESFARFSIGHDQARANTIFQQLQGTSDLTEKHILYVDFMEMKNGLPLNLKMLTCTLDQLAENCKMVTKELFKMHNC